MKINVTGATGSLGQKITEELLKIGTDKEIAVTVRNGDKAKQIFGERVSIHVADYQSTDKMMNAFTGTDTLVYIPSIVHPNLKRIAEFENVLSAVEKAKVKQLIVIGFFADHENNPFVLSPFYGYVPRRLASANVHYTIVRNAMYADPLPPYLPELIERGKLVYPAGDGKINFVSRRDLARAIAQIAIQPELYGKTYTLTGKKAYSMPELAEILSEASGHTIVYDPMTAQEFADTYDEPKGFGPILASLYVAASCHLMDETTNDIESITGQEPEDLLSFIKRNYKG
ncbi:SDR family oxidoreductase [Fervidibacillus halotolerans]|uniref:SDR family oxidoreductase n=1 Tax=Fervidibacillus halotolerans TaxID=2980027 RepID=A0A9E8LYT0_9BACI|nr:SDR family oxidoreductase [Fervidibacillus halotolerans]WAA12263.1 SDR family oxidoreductase [Fervidibacillus halotolerans]